MKYFILFLDKQTSTKQMCYAYNGYVYHMKRQEDIAKECSNLGSLT